jgi:hypothetical protein
MTIRDILITGKTAKLPGDYGPLNEPEIRKAAQFRPGSVEPVALIDGTRFLHIVLAGPPMGKPRMTQRDKWAKRDCVVRYRDWADRLRAAAGTVPPAKSVLDLSWVAYFEPPASWSKKRRWAAIGEPHRVKPDASNILKGIEDILWPDGDSALAAGHYEKLWDPEPRLEIGITIQFVPTQTPMCMED